MADRSSGEAPVPLVCPACRHVEDGQLLVRGLRKRGATLTCACGREYPIVAGIPVVLQDLAGWAASEGADALRDPLAAPELVRLLAVDTASRRNARLLAAYSALPPSEFSAWLSETVTNAVGPILEIGAGLGHPGTIRLDLNLTLLRAGAPPPPLVDSEAGVAVSPGGALVADAADPPFAGSTFATVILANVLDSCRDPALVLGQADALIRPRGQLVIGCAYAFDESITTPSAQFTETQLAAALRGEAKFGPYELDVRLTQPPFDLPWRIRAGPRTEHVHRVQVLIARRPG